MQIGKLFMFKNRFVFLAISLDMCFGCSKEPSLPDGSFEYTVLLSTHNKCFG